MLFTKHYKGDEIKEDEMCRAYSFSQIEYICVLRKNQNIVNN
jgi:hypothetical protein